MLYSMTGFGARTSHLILQDGRKLSLAIELKSVNARFFEAVCKLSSPLSSLEVSLITLLRKRLLRGRLYLSMFIVEGEGAFESLLPSFEHLQSYITVAQDIQKRFDLPGELEVKDIIQLPDIFVKQRGSLSEPDMAKMIEEVKSVADLLMGTRHVEGEELERDMRKSLEICTIKIEHIKGYFEQYIIELKQKIHEALTLYEQTPSDQLKIQLDELYATLHKSDINEEIVRFTSHGNAVVTCMQEKVVEKGKKLDFMFQELLREINTIMAKCVTFQISSVGVDIKVEVEKMREQVQNIL